MLASVLAGYLAPGAALYVLSLSPAAFTKEALQLPLAVLIGLTSHRVLGPAVMRFAIKKAEDMSK
jgi:hypothetical protein